jgi:hypothetical protein
MWTGGGPAAVAQAEPTPPCPSPRQSAKLSRFYTSQDARLARQAMRGVVVHAQERPVHLPFQCLSLPSPNAALWPPHQSARAWTLYRPGCAAVVRGDTPTWAGVGVGYGVDDDWSLWACCRQHSSRSWLGGMLIRHGIDVLNQGTGQPDRPVSDLFAFCRGGCGARVARSSSRPH